MNSRLVSEAAIILGVTKHHVEKIRQIYPQSRGKTYLLSEYFGSSGDIENPFCEENESDPEALERYRKCRDHLKTIIEPNVDAVYNRIIL